jgi:hypothetical protein
MTIKITKIILGCILVLIAGFYVVTNHSISDEKILSCNGSFYKDGKSSENVKIAFNILKFRWWVNIWSDSPGVGYVQLEDGQTDYLDTIEFVRGWNDIAFDGSNGMKSGRYFGLTKKIRYIDPFKRPYEGNCVE